MNRCSFIAMAAIEGPEDDVIMKAALYDRGASGSR
jgi:hypothetical protein